MCRPPLEVADLIHAEALLRHSSTGSRCRSAHHPDAVRPSRSGRNHHLPPSLGTSPQRDCQSSGLAEEERRITTGRLDVPATTGGGRSDSRCRSCIHRTKPPLAQREASQSPAGHSALSYRRTRRPSRSVHPLRASRHLLQLLPEPALSEMSEQCPRPLAPSTAPGASPDALRACCLHPSS